MTAYGSARSNKNKARVTSQSAAGFETDNA